MDKWTVKNGWILSDGARVSEIAPAWVGEADSMCALLAAEGAVRELMEAEGEYPTTGPVAIAFIRLRRALATLTAAMPPEEEK